MRILNIDLVNNTMLVNIKDLDLSKIHDLLMGEMIKTLPSTSPLKTKKQKPKKIDLPFNIISEKGVTEIEDSLVTEEPKKEKKKEITFDDVTKKTKLYMSRGSVGANERISTLKTILKTDYGLVNIKDLKEKDFESFFNKIPTLDK